MVKYPQIDDIFDSLSDKTRREIVLKLHKNTLNVSEVYQPFKRRMTLPALSKHLKVLEHANLIKKQKVGRVRNISLTEIAKYWVKQLDRLEKFLSR